MKKIVEPRSTTTIDIVLDVKRFNGERTERYRFRATLAVFAASNRFERDAVIKSKRGRIIRQQFSFVAKFIAHLASYTAKRTGNRWSLWIPSVTINHY